MKMQLCLNTKSSAIALDFYVYLTTSKSGDFVQWEKLISKLYLTIKHKTHRNAMGFVFICHTIK